ncbi:tetratricopeptide (TPR) repeat protein [Dysgonomonas hofstadii]|uniref:Tetratricopeptide (TPR) repeat protein n=1 Tax=Dysgonomonas hofstadii TaxID=637886 RepID=A0A840CJ59_9BACT|nr:tetratricopeptide repeat protein [Dysgonomonas hofstadii]MBB4035201.1 tetratricopeptide (TPR) repeat protein [Dysgonomonas hofstadii]
MKRILLITSLCVLAGFSFAQKKAVKDAKSAMKKDIPEARTLIKPALTDPETANDPETWKLAGDIEYTAFDNERTLEMQKQFTGKGGNEEAMYTGLYNMYDPYIKADELGQLPNEKGEVKNKVRKDIVKNMLDGHKYFINGGVFYNDKQNYKRAADFFERYWEMPTLAMFEGSKEAFVIDSIFQTIKYYAVISSIQSQDHARSIKLLNKIMAEPYIANTTYKESDVYELLASEYQQVEDSLSYVKTLREGAQKFPSNKYFTPNLINEFIRGGKVSEALTYLDQAIANDPSNTCDLMSVKASLYAEQKNYDEAAPAYTAAIAADPNCERALEGLGVLYVLQAQDLKEKASQAASRREQAEMDKQTSELYLKALPYLEKYYDLLKAKNADTYEVRPALMKLQNVYYNLSLLDVDKSSELKVIDDALKAITGETEE